MGWTWRHRMKSSRRVRLGFELLEARTLLSTFTVVDLGDAGTGSGRQGDLRYCITAANANNQASNRIVFQPGLAGTITLTQGELDITKSLAIDGPGAGLLTISGNHHSGVFALTNDPRLADFRMSDLTVADGTGILDPAFGNFHAGGGLYDYNPHATATLIRCTFANNAVSGRVDFGGAVAVGLGTLVMDSCTLTGNHAGLEGGALAVNGPATLVHCTLSGNTALQESAIYNNSNSTFTLDASTVVSNTADTTGGYTGDAILSGGRMMTITGSRIADNVGSVPGVDNVGGRMVITDSTIADNVGGGVRNAGSMMISGSTISGNMDMMSFAGGLYATDVGTGSDTNISNSTISGNRSMRGVGGIWLFRFQDSVELTSCTITDNSAPDIGGLAIVHNDQNGNSALVVARNTIIAGNNGSMADVSGPVVSLGYNLIGQSDGSSGWRSTDLTGTSRSPLDPQLSPLQDNGGPTLTHAPAVTSPAHARGDLALYGSFDQRGTPREDLLVPPDIGSVTFDQPLHLAVLAPDQVARGMPFSLTVVALDNWGNRAYTYEGTIHFSSSDPAARLPADLRFRANEWGARAFTVTLATVGRQTIQVVDSLGFPSGSASLVVQKALPQPDLAGPAWDWVFAAADLMVRPVFREGERRGARPPVRHPPGGWRPSAPPEMLPRPDLPERRRLLPGGTS